MKERSQISLAEKYGGEWRAVGRYIFQALGDIAEKNGGSEYRQEIEEMAKSDEVLPDPKALESVEQAFPGAAREVLDLASKIQKQAHAQEINKLNNKYSTYSEIFRHFRK